MAALLVTLFESPAPAQFPFTDVTTGSLNTLILSWGASWVDVDGDHDLDLFVSRQGPTGGNVLFRNSGGTLTRDFAGALTDTLGAGSIGHTWADYDNDGDLDVYVAGGAGRLLRNDGATFTIVPDGPLAPLPRVQGWTGAWGDYDMDGWLDLVVVHPAGFVSTPHTNHLFHATGGGAFERDETTPISDSLAPYTVGTWSDYDLDGDPDLFVGSGPALGTTAPDFLYENTGGGTFARIATDPIATDERDGQVMNWMDMDNDGDFDLFVTNYWGGGNGMPNHLYRNDAGTYVRVTTGPLATDTTILGLANTWGDVDNDGDLDVYVAASNPQGQNLGIDRLYLNDGHGSFTTALTLSNGSTSGATLGDYDADGDLDLATTDPSGNGSVHVLRNDTPAGNHWLQLDLVGTTSNRSAIGALVWVTATIGGVPVTQMREVSSQNTFNGQNALTVHVGLGNATSASEVRIRWPNGDVEVLTGVGANQRLTLTEGSAAAAEPEGHGSVLQLDTPAPNPVHGEAAFRFTLPTAGSATLAVYDTMGRRVAVLHDGPLAAGAHAVAWDRAAEGGALADGAYLLRLDTPDGTATRPLVLAR